MAKVHFLLKDHNKVSTEKCLILLVVRLDEKLVYSISEKISKQDWDFASQMPKALKNRPDLAELTLFIRRLILHIDTETLKLRNKEVAIRKRLMEEIIDRYLGKSKQEKTLMWYISNEFIQNKRKDNITASLDIGRYITKAIPDVTINMIDGALFDRVYKQMIADGKTRNTMLNYLRFIIRIAKDLDKRYDINFPKSLKNKSKEIPSFEKVRKVALSIDDLMKIHSYNPNDAFIELIKDSFVLMSFIGVRIKDARSTNSLNFNDINGEKVYIKDTSKVGVRVVIPLHHIAKEVLSKYDSYKFPNISNYNLYKNIKAIAKDAGIDGSITYTITKGGKKVTITKQRWECITPHTARRSFATNMHKAGIPPKVAMMFTGHKTLQQYMDYIQITEEEAATEYMHHLFFKGKE